MAKSQMGPGPILGKIPRHGYLFLEKLPLDMGMDFSQQLHIPGLSKSETPLHGERKLKSHTTQAA